MLGDHVRVRPAVQDAGAGRGDGSVTSNMNFYVLQFRGSRRRLGHGNNIATNMPVQEVIDPQQGQLLRGDPGQSGTAPGHVEFVGLNETQRRRGCQPGIRQRRRDVLSGAAIGHEASAATIGVAATPWWAPAPSWARTRWPTSRSARPGRGRSTSAPRARQSRRRSSRTRRSPPPTAAIPRSLNRPYRHVQPAVPRRAGDIRQTWSRPGPASLWPSSAPPRRRPTPRPWRP